MRKKDIIITAKIVGFDMCKLENVIAEIKIYKNELKEKYFLKEICVFGS